MTDKMHATPFGPGALARLYSQRPSGDGLMTPAMELALAASFGSLAAWREAFLAMGRNRDGGSRWLCLVFRPQDARLVNRWVAEDLDTGLPLLTMPAPAMESDAAAFMNNIHWQAVYERYQQAVHEGSEACGASNAELAGALLLDVRREAVFKAAATRIPGAQWKNPAEVDHWANCLPTDRKIIVHCVFGHEVSRATAMRLRAAGLNAQYLRGGIDAWQAAGLAVEAKEKPP